MKKLIKEKWLKMQEMSENMKRDHISESAAQCSYYTILSFIPFLILLITLIQYTGIAPQTLFDAISKIIPSSMSEMVLGIVQEVYSKSIGTISISIIFTIWTAGKGFYALTAGLQTVYQTKGTEIGWFVTIMPATNNREALELVSMTENVKKRGGSGYVVNKTKKIMEEYLQ